MREPDVRYIIRPAIVVLACAVLALTTAGLGMLSAFGDLAPWNGLAVCLLLTAVAAGAGGSVYLRHHQDYSHSSRTKPVP